MENEIQIIRALWGNSKRTINEIFQLPLFKNEMVYVWGIDNQIYLKNLGYDTILMDHNISNPLYSTIELQYFHKLEVISKAEEKFNEFIFIDWDCFIVKPLDDYFYNSLKNGNDIQVSIYAYPNEINLGITNLITHKSTQRYETEISVDLLRFLKGMESQLRLHHWDYKGLLVSPNFCFFYTRRPGIGKELIEIANLYKIENCVEEHSMFRWANCELDEFIDKYEPIVLQGSSDESRTLIHEYDWKNDAIIIINNYISSKKEKNIYFKHI